MPRLLTPWPAAPPPPLRRRCDRAAPEAAAAHATTASASPPPLALRLLHETERLLVVDKPPGLPFHEDDGGPGVLQAARAAQACGAWAYGGRLHGVHRLDRVTSGVLVLAKSAHDAGLLGGAFRAGNVRKLYVALSARRPSKKMGVVVGDMARSRRGAWMLLHSRERPATTRFVSSGVVGSRPGLRGFVLRPLTGRTHQLRVALKSLGAPVLGDALYAAAADAAREERAYLHAAALHVPALAPGEAPLCVVCPPSSGAEFLTPQFQAWFAELFPPGAPPEAWCHGAPALHAAAENTCVWDDTTGSVDDGDVL